MSIYRPKFAFLSNCFFTRWNMCRMWDFWMFVMCRIVPNNGQSGRHVYATGCGRLSSRSCVCEWCEHREVLVARSSANTLHSSNTPSHRQQWGLVVRVGGCHTTHFLRRLQGHATPWCAYRWSFAGRRMHTSLFARTNVPRGTPIFAPQWRHGPLDLIGDTGH